MVVSLLEEVEETPPTEKELKKQKRLAAFRSDPLAATSKIYPVELQGKGRVLMDVPSGEQIGPGSPEPSPSKKRTPSRRKKRVGGGGVDKRSRNSESHEDRLEKPDWPDTEFPWRLRTEERIEQAKAEQEERLRWIERYLDHDSDDDDADEQVAIPSDYLVPAVIYDQGPRTSYQVKMGRGKMIPLSVAPDDHWNLIPKRPFPVDPADAREALLSKKSVRTLSYRQQKRKRLMEDDEDDDDEVLCICNGKDDGRELVQCDSCQTWYHLECIGIKNIAELGKEEDPWFCRSCNSRSPSPMKFDEVPSSEPTFVPTDPSTHGRRSSDATFFQPSVQDSPNWPSSKIPRTPTRGTHSFSDYSRSPWNWTDSSRLLPSTPQSYFLGSRKYSTPGSLDPHNLHHYDESPFDPTSTPSRGIKFHIPFATPKTAVWQTRPNPLFQTPSRTGGSRGLHRSHVPHSASLDDNSLGNVTHYPFPRVLATDESPIRRNKSTDATLGHRRHFSPPRVLS